MAAFHLTSRLRQLGTMGGVLLLCHGSCLAVSDHSRTASQAPSASGQDALEKLIAREEANLTNQLGAADQRARATAQSGDGLGTYMLILAGLVTGIVVLHKVWPVLAKPFISDEEPCAAEPAAPLPDVHAEVFSNFLDKFNSNQKSPPDLSEQKPTSESIQLGQPAGPQLTLPFEPVLVAHVNALDQVSTIRALFLDLNRATTAAERSQGLTGLLTAVRGLRKGLRVSAAYSIGQLASALEALVSKLASQEESPSASAMRTIAGGIDLLPSLCSPGIRSDLASNPVISLLAVDDDAVSRHALTSALKRVWARPDLANDGQEGLRLAETRPYDLVFVDIEMPGMDGFELCSRIHSTTLNPGTPVVFVTSHNDLSTRARSSLAGGLEFLTKPFLTSELTLKALTLVLKRRLQQPIASTVGRRMAEEESSKKTAAGNASSAATSEHQSLRTAVAAP